MTKRNNRYKKLFLLPLFIFMISCVELYDFVIEDENPYLVVEGYISDASFDETLSYPSDGRYFSVKLSYTSEVRNTWGQYVSGANVKLIDDLNNQWTYTEVFENRPIYYLLDRTFEALPDREYKLIITLPNENIFESDWVKLPSQPTEIGEISFREEEKDGYDYIRGKKEIITVKGISAFINLPDNTQNAPIYYKWNFDVTWIINTPYAIPEGGGIPSTCYVTSDFYLNEFTLQEDITGEYPKDLFFLQTEGNERIDDEISVLINQQTLNKDYFFFWKELKESNTGNPILEKQPFNLETNFSAVNSDDQVAGYFDVVSEKATRWYFGKDKLSYHLPELWKQLCQEAQGAPGPPPAGCISCLGYPKGEVTDQKPAWWDPK